MPADLRGTAALLAAAALGAAPAIAAPAADLVIVNAKLYTADGSNRFEQALAIRGGRIAAVGTDARIRRLVGRHTKVVDAHGGAVVPGLIDTHTHLMGGAASLDQADVTGAKTGAELSSRLRAYAAAHPEKAIIEAYGYFPLTLTRFDFDDAAGGRPIIIRAGDWHSTLVNTAALALAGIADSDPADPSLPRDEHGRLTGLLMESAQAKIEAALPQPTKADRLRLLARATEACHAAGITSAVVVGGQDDLALFQTARTQNKLGLRIAFAQWLTRDERSSGFPHDFAFDERDADKLGAVRAKFRDDPMLHFDMVKIMSDGVIESHTAAMLAPYEDQPANRGHANYSKEDLERIVTMMDRRGWQIMLHALGDGAVRMALDAFEAAARANPEPRGGRRHKIEHIESIDPADIPRFKALNVTASMQPAHAMGMVDPKRSGQRWRYLGYLRSSWGWPWASVKAAGGRVAFGSDWPVAPLNIGMGTFAAVNRLPNPPVPDQRLSVRDVIDGYTRDAAYSIFRDRDLGTLQPGKRADVAIFQSDIFSNAPSRSDIAVRATLLDGKLVYCATAPRPHSPKTCP